jgi:hypothetical protein
MEPRRCGESFDGVDRIAAKGQAGWNCVITLKYGLIVTRLTTASTPQRDNVLRTFFWPEMPSVCYDLLVVKLAEDIHETAGLSPGDSKYMPEVL